MPDDHSREDSILGLILGLPLLVIEALAPYLYIGVLLLAGITDSPWIYHPILFLGMFVPGIALFICAFKWRDPSPKVFARICNVLGTTGCLVGGCVIIFFYVSAVIAKAGS